MPRARVVTFRSQTMGQIADLIHDEGLSCQASQDILSFLAGTLVRYQDEGIELIPNILFCEDADSALKTFPGAVRYQVGAAPLTSDSVNRILKECAPLTVGGWCIYIERTSTTDLKYGVFNYLQLPTTIPLAEAISLMPDLFCVLVRRTSPSTIEIRGSKGNSLSLIFSTVREQPIQSDPISAFAIDCCLDLGNADDFRIYFQRLLEQALTRSHGTILATTRSNNLRGISELKDAIPVVPKLDIYAAFMGYREIGSAESIVTLQNRESLLTGLLHCDGIVMFNTQGCVIAYRVFYRPGSQDPVRAEPLAGGPAAGLLKERKLLSAVVWYQCSSGHKTA